ncbi:MAG: hypothetical protein JWO80_88 [Bryobacterales bacterium]|nr:hypothetical protein [Bryobacterales bacterium]
MGFLRRKRPKRIGVEASTLARWERGPTGTLAGHAYASSM